MRTIFILILFSYGSLSAQWTSSNGPSGGSINSITSHKGSYFMAAGYFSYGSVLRSIDGGESWELKISGMPYINRINVIAGNDEYLFAGTQNKGIYRSSDSGENWVDVTTGINGVSISIQAIYFKNDTLWIGTYFDGVYYSTDNGNNWTELNEGITGYKSIRTITSAGDYLFAGTGDAFYRLNDQMVWEKKEEGIDPDNRYFFSSVYDGEYLFAGGLNAVYRSSDFGENWEETTNGYTGNSPRNMVTLNGKVYAGTGDRVSWTDNHGALWHQMSAGMPQYMTVNGVYADENHIFAGSQFRGAYSWNGTEWTNLHNGVIAVSARSLEDYNGTLFTGTLFADFGEIWQKPASSDLWQLSNEGATERGYHSILSWNGYLFAGSDGDGIYKSDDDGATWEKAGEYPITFSYISDVEGGENYIFASVVGFNIDLWRSSDFGDTWEETSLPGTGDVQDSYWFQDTLYASRTTGVYYSTDEGTSWNEMNNGFSANPFITKLEKHKGRLYAATRSYDLYYYDYNQNQWIEDFGWIDDEIFSLLSNVETLFAASENKGVFSLNESSGMWENISEGLPSDSRGEYPEVYDLLRIDNKLYAALESFGVWEFDLAPVPVELTNFSADISGNEVLLSWETVTEVNNMGFAIERMEENSDWKEIAFINGAGNSTETLRYSFTDNISAGDKISYRLKQIDFDGASNYSEVLKLESLSPDDFALFQNYPNPFNPSTTISFSLPSAGNVKLTVYNLLGQKMAVLVDGKKEAVYHKVNWDTAGFAAGVYIYKVTVELSDGSKFVSTKKMTLLK